MYIWSGPNFEVFCVEPSGPANHMSSSIGALYRVMTKKL